ncbi:hypothetical protein KJ359_001739 [Pestalotiopsis sp. 9143b]|nr:hypothetical protein KJ359_001739 [Pestalotiopsis sp. 9143b]
MSRMKTYSQKGKGKGKAQTRGKAAAKRLPSRGKKGPVAQPQGRGRRWKAGTVALREIRKLQTSTALLIKKAPFLRLVREIAGYYRPDMRFQSAAVLALQEVAESQITKMFEISFLAAVHAKRVTLMPKDMQLVRHILTAGEGLASSTYSIDRGHKIEYRSAKRIEADRVAELNQAVRQQQAAKKQSAKKQSAEKQPVRRRFGQKQPAEVVEPARRTRNQQRKDAEAATRQAALLAMRAGEDEDGEDVDEAEGEEEGEEEGRGDDNNNEEDEDFEDAAEE